MLLLWVLQALPVNPGQDLLEIAWATQTDVAELAKYNKWLKDGATVPADKTYTVLLPVTNEQAVAGVREELCASSWKKLT
ncbi:hypothetical protein, partial [Pontibacter silvestris]